MNEFDASIVGLSPDPGMIVGKIQYDQDDANPGQAPKLVKFEVLADGTLDPISNRRGWWVSNRGWLALVLVALALTATILARRSNRHPLFPRT